MKSSIISLVLNNFTNDSRVHKEAESLSVLNKDVTVVALHEGELEEFQSTELYKIHRLKLTTRKWGRFKFIQLLKYIEFFIRFVWKYRKEDTFHCHDLPALPIGVFMKLITFGKANVIYDTHEFAINDVPYESKKRQKAKFYTERFFIKYADKVITVSESIAKEYQALYGIKKPYLLLNCPKYNPEIFQDNVFRSLFKLPENSLIFLYQGALTPGRGIEFLLKFFSENKNKDHVLVLMGYGSLEPLVKEYVLNSSNIHLKEAVPPHDILRFTSSADIGISFIQDSCLSYRYCLPNKMFEYLMSGVPVIVSNLPEMVGVIEKYSVGVTVKENTNKSFNQAIRSLLSIDKDTLVANINNAKSDFCWEKQELVLKEIYESL